MNAKRGIDVSNNYDSTTWDLSTYPEWDPEWGNEWEEEPVEEEKPEWSVEINYDYSDEKFNEIDLSISHWGETNQFLYGSIQAINSTNLV